MNKTTKRELLYLADLAHWVYTAPKRPPQRLSNFLGAQGSLKDWHGEITTLTGGKQYRITKATIWMVWNPAKIRNQ